MHGCEAQAESSSGSHKMSKKPAAVKAKPKLSFKVRPLDLSEHLDSEERIAEYLAACLEDPNPAVFMAALADVAKARGMTKIAADAGLTRASLYKACASGAHPRHATVAKVLKSLGLQSKRSASRKSGSRGRR
jgi:probable addiction module antidote protein